MNETITVTMRSEHIPLLKQASSKLEADAIGKSHKPRDPLQVEAFDREETGESHVETVAAAELRQFVERIERLEGERDDIGGDIKDVFGEAKGRGYDTKAIRTIIRLRKKDANERIEEESILQSYMAALGME